MKKEALRIVFMGTPDFAVASLRALVEGHYNVVGVITMPDKPMGRHGSVLRGSAVKDYAVSVGLPLLQPVKLKDEQFLLNLRAWKADLQVVVAFRMLPEIVWDMPRLGTFNLHGSLLPQYRGAAPLNWSIINGDSETGVTTFFISHEIDTGKIVRQLCLPIAETDNVEVIHDKLMIKGAGLVTETVDLLLEGKVDAIPQEQFIKEGMILRPAPKLCKANCKINWTWPQKRIYDFVRGLSPYPTAWTELLLPDGKKKGVKIYQTEKIVASHKLKPGTIQTDQKTSIDVAVEGGFIRLLDLQLSGKKRMDVKSFLNGNQNIGKCCFIAD